MADRTDSGNASQRSPNPVQVQKFLGGLDYPVDKATLLDQAENAGADDRVLEALRALPEQEYDSPTAISRQLGQLH
ncbi:DUF2795 domain-containing protein [Chitiniphilus purpureus]|uniref:DUF2795 domain-containing protein n=1 Tax=Chitiniphilus purpureus TaxID=2981137 RepID=A0ABY6DWS6_9NEIS|nr:DUF2795 domain-containing protein [Chitiniphilus sp. CD1]UXY16303.1 DUF2795 domain-containing protein [Chitiniphilus sp. CD1]